MIVGEDSQTVPAARAGSDGPHAAISQGKAITVSKIGHVVIPMYHTVVKAHPTEHLNLYNADIFV